MADGGKIKLGRIEQKMQWSKLLAEPREDLENIGLDNQRHKGDFDLLKKALLVYKSIYGDLMVPLEYKIAVNDARYPENVRGNALGDTVHAIRAGTIYVKHEAELQEIGFSYNRQVGQFYPFIQVTEALQAYKVLHGDLKVPQSYIIAEDDMRYPENVRGMELGAVVSNTSIGNGRSYADFRKELKDMGFVYEEQLYTFAEVKEALLVYKTLYDDMEVPRSYSIEEDDTRYPESLRGMWLGKIVSNIRNKGYYYADYREELEAMGFLPLYNISYGMMI